MKHFLLIANWKSNPQSLESARVLARSLEREAKRIRGVDIVVAPPYPFLIPVQRELRKINLGAQDSFWTFGPYTGDVSPRQLSSLGVGYVIIGHSERRIYHGETDSLINKKMKAVLEAGMSPVVCVGERERTGRDIPALVGEQVRGAFREIPSRFYARIGVAYEPVWAISTTPGAVPDTPENSFRASMYIRRVLADAAGKKSADSVRILYGGSVSPLNIGSFVRDGGVDGALVGGASLDRKAFGEIIRITSRAR